MFAIYVTLFIFTVKQSQDRTAFELTPPHKKHLHVFKFESEAECTDGIQKIKQFVEEFKKFSSLAEEGNNEKLSENLYRFKIPSTIKIHSQKLGETFAAYLVDICDAHGNSNTIVKRYSQFYSLHCRLMKKKKYATKLPKMPEKKLLNMDPKFVQKRCLKLESYLNGLNGVSGVFDEPVLKRFLTTGVEDELGEDADSSYDVAILGSGRSKVVIYFFDINFDLLARWTFILYSVGQWLKKGN